MLLNIQVKIDINRHRKRYKESQNYKKYIGPYKHSQVYRHTFIYTLRHTKIQASTWRDIGPENLCSTPKTDKHMYRNTEEI